MKLLHPYRAIGFAILDYIVSLLFMLLFGGYVSARVPQDAYLLNYFFYWGMLGILVTAPLFTFLYFRTKIVSINAKAGFLFGVTIFVVALFLDLLFSSFVILLSGERFSHIFFLYRQPLFWVSILETFALAALTAEWIRKRRLKVAPLTKSS